MPLRSSNRPTRGPSARGRSAAAPTRPPSWLLALMVCPQVGCAGRLGRRRGLLHCGACGMLYPVFGGVPILVPAPHQYCAAYREPLIAALAEQGELDRTALATIDAFAETAPGTEPLRFGDDWTAADALARWPAAGITAAASFRRFILATGSFEDRVARLAPERPGVALELGCGDGGLGRRLAPRCKRLVVADLSLRAVLRAQLAAGSAGRVAGCVLDADAAPLGPAGFDTVLCLNLVDLLDHPLELPGAIAAALRPGGQLVLSSPDPELGGADPEPLFEALAGAGLVIDAAIDQLPWLRLHPPRHAQVYFCMLVVASRRAARKRRQRKSP